MRRIFVLMSILVLSIAGCGDSPPDGPAQLTAEEKEELKQQLKEVQASEAAQQ